MEKLTGKKIALIAGAVQFRDEELLEPLKIFQNYGATVDIASTRVGTIKGKLGATATATMLYSAITAANYDAIIFVGGPGASEYFDDTTAHRIIQEMLASGKIIAAICIAPKTLGNAGILNGKRATIFPGDEDSFTGKNITYVAADVVVDGNIITANGPKSATKFAETITTEILKR